MFSPESFKAASFRPVSWKFPGVVEVVQPATIVGGLGGFGRRNKRWPAKPRKRLLDPEIQALLFTRALSHRHRS